jgi:hypothetical protein
MVAEGFSGEIHQDLPMRIKIDGTCLVIDLTDLLGQLDLEQKRNLADALACQEDVIKDVIGQVLDGHTASGSYSALCCTAQANPAWPGLDWACREVAKRAGETAEREIKRLEEAVKFKDEQLQEMWKENNSLRSSR